MNLFQYRITQFPEYASNQVCDKHTHDSEGCQLSVVIPLAKHLTERERKVEKFKECFVPRLRTE